MFLSNFHDDWANIVTSSVFTRQTAPPTGGHVFQRTRTTFERNQHIIKTNISTKLHEDWARNVTSTVFTSFQLHRDIIGTNLLTKFHEDRTKMKTAPPTCGHVFQQTRTNFELNQHIIKTNILTNFELDRDIIWTKLLTKFHEDRKRNVPSRVPVTKAHLSNQETKVLTKFHENWAKNVTSRVFTLTGDDCITNSCEKNAPPTGGHVFSPIWTIFDLVRDINKTNVLTNFHDDWAKIVTSSVFTRKTAPPTGGHVFQRTGTIFELNQHVINTNILRKSEINVASRVFTNKCGRTDKDRSQKLT
ncbi:hypothetical protein DPMN_007043 [Dreissena polymorpha]|uniref:Uncharacterized protein n=1 Tax=Dreissena polymorpha TaxID=45954 RepID=A0A9D4RY10_DREPO|nr:hypothetical protein DPMN_007043 [Dreissena polymorpha]